MHSHILVYNDSDIFAGTERHIADLACGLAKAGENVAVGCPAAAPLRDLLKGHRIAQLSIEKVGALDRAAIRFLLPRLKSGEIDLIHTHNGRTAINAAIAIRLAGRGKLVMTQHFVSPARTTRRGPKKWVSFAMHRWLLRRLDHQVAISTAVLDQIMARGEALPGRLSLVRNGTSDPDTHRLRAVKEVRRELGVADDQILVVCAARLEPEKDVATLIRAMGRLRGSNYVAVVAGTGKLRDELATLIRQQRSAVRLLGFQSEVLAIMRAGDLFVLPSPAEPFGLVLLEAMALGKPVIAASAGGPLEIVDEGETGLLIQPGDDLAFATAIQRLALHENMRFTMGHNARRRFIQYFTAERMAADMLRVYQQVLHGQVLPEPAHEATT